MKFLCSSLLVLISLQANAANQPTKINVLNFPVKDFEATQKQKEEIYKNLGSAISQVSNGYVAMPEYVNLTMTKTYSNAFYSTLGQIIVTPYQLNIKGLTKHPKYTRGVELHEFGHAVFESNYPIIFKNNKNALSLFSTYVKEKKSFEAIALNYFPLMVADELSIGTAVTPEFLERYMKADEAMGNLMRSDEGQIINMITMIGQSYVAVNEFFADVFAVVLTKDPDTINSALQFSAHTDVKVSDRSFRLRLGKRDLNVEAHNLYGLSRYYIYKYYLSNPIVKKMGSSWILNRTLESIRCGQEETGKQTGNILREAGKVPAANQARFAMEKLNDILNRCIDQEFSK